MPLIQYQQIAFTPEKLDLLAKCKAVIRDYATQGFSLTLRQLYYQAIAHDLFPDSWASKAGIKNRPENYDRLGTLISDARLAGLVDWNAIVDLGRTSYAHQHWTRPSQIIEQARNSYMTNKWDNQPEYVEVWVEKQALENIIGSACGPLDVRYFACKGYTSQSAMWEASQRLISQMEKGKEVHIIHLGDHDPSGIDMSRDIEERLSMFTYKPVDVERIALNMPQVTQYNPPPNPAKSTDSRFQSYLEKFGDESWELDALDPATLVALIQKAILKYRDEALWQEAVKTEEKGRSTLKYICQYFPEVISFLREVRTKDTSPIVCQECGATQAHPQCLCRGDGEIRQVE